MHIGSVPLHCIHMEWVHAKSIPYPNLVVLVGIFLYSSFCWPILFFFSFFGHDHVLWKIVRVSFKILKGRDEKLWEVMLKQAHTLKMNYKFLNHSNWVYLKMGFLNIVIHWQLQNKLNYFLFCWKFWKKKKKTLTLEISKIYIAKIWNQTVA
jgi:hypothetical protein